ncbi:hypothetical protein HPP92_015918 [Vanilla planifolia]|uniref:Uncharacterized protein n=1 Tax=Vanilla planifolia TaxID=51239 RepID=A0A835QN74_VANPL|nr:hypothetical protein HPP92_015918 [Vanilla planifolia]
MVAISLYRGNLHRVPDIPRRWPMPKRAISLRQFRRLLYKRTLIMSRISSRNPSISPGSGFSGGKDEVDGMGENETAEERLGNRVSSIEPSGSTDLPLQNGKDEAKEAEGKEELNQHAKEGVVSKEVVGSSVGDGTGSSGDGKQEEVIDNLDALDDKEVRKRDLQNKLHALNERKHCLVQMLKQILNAEEEIKRRSAQPSLSRSPVPQQAEAPIDMGHAAKNPPKITVEVNFGDAGGESDAIVNRSNQARQWPHAQGVPSSPASIGRHQHCPSQPNMAMTVRGSTLHHATSSSMMVGSMVSPSRFALAAHSTSLPLASISGTHFAGSSPSPAASGGASSALGEAK